MSAENAVRFVEENHSPRIELRAASGAVGRMLATMRATDAELREPVARIRRQFLLAHLIEVLLVRAPPRHS